MADSAAAPAASCRNLRRGNSVIVSSFTIGFAKNATARYYSDLMPARMAVCGGRPPLDRGGCPDAAPSPAKAFRDKCPASGRADRPAGPAEPSITGQDDRLIAMFDANLVEHSSNVVTHRLFRETEQSGDLRVVEAFCNRVEYRPFPRREIAQAQCVAAGPAVVSRLGQKLPHLGVYPRPCRLLR